MIDHILIIDIDALRPDVFYPALAAGKIPHLAALLGGDQMARGVRIPIVTTAPSITFCAQATIFTGAHPRQHGIPGNQFFDRFGDRPRFFAFDMGDTLEVDDAVGVYRHGLAAGRLQAPTFYQRMAARGKTAVVAGNMYAAGAATWLRPALVNLARFIKGGNLFGLSAPDYDRHLLRQLQTHMADHGLDAITTMYFLGLDHISHKHGPAVQTDYLVDNVDPMVGGLWQTMQEAGADPARTLVAIVSDHGQIGVPNTAGYALRMAFPFERELSDFFVALGLDVHDYPGEAPHCDAVMALNGGLAHVYLHNRELRWRAAPAFKRDVVPVAQAFWEAHESGRYTTDLQGAVAAVLLRDVAGEGWTARYRAMTPAGEMVTLADWFAAQPNGRFADPVHRLHHLAGPYSGDVIVISDYDAGYYFGKAQRGMHGGLHVEDSRATLAFGVPGAAESTWTQVADTVTTAIERRCRQENGRSPATVDMVTGLTAVVEGIW